MIATLYAAQERLRLDATMARGNERGGPGRAAPNAQSVLIADEL